MPTEIFASPTRPEADTNTVPADSSWVDGAWGQGDHSVAEVWRAAHAKVLAEFSAYRREAHERTLAAITEAGERERAAYKRGRLAEAEHAKRQADTKEYLAKLDSARKMPIEYWRGPTGEGYIYVVGFSTGTVKVGHTEDPKGRLNHHQSEALAYGVGTLNYWVSQPHWNFKENETELIRLCRELCRKEGRRSRREYYHGLGYERVMELVDNLTFHSAGDEVRCIEGSWV
jgi:hypothetical protein